MRTQCRSLFEGSQWLNLPEYFLSRWGGARVAELTNATHTQMVELYNAAVVPGRSSTAPNLDLAGAAEDRSAGHRDRQAERSACRAAGLSRYGTDCARLSRYGFGDRGYSGHRATTGLTSARVPGRWWERCWSATNGAAAATKTSPISVQWGDDLLPQKCERHVAGSAVHRPAGLRDGRFWTVPELTAAARNRYPIPKGLMDVDDPNLVLAGANAGADQCAAKAGGFGPFWTCAPRMRPYLLV